jgi:hypothetical protein
MNPATDVKTWLEQGDALRAKLVEERAAHVARIAEIDTALKALGAAPTLEPPVARQVVDLVAGAPRPMTAREVQAALPSLSRLAVGSALYAAVRRDELVAAGRKGALTYRRK